MSTKLRGNRSDATGTARATGTYQYKDSFRDLVAAREWLVGTVVSSSDPVLAERIAQWFDFVWIDLEHSALSVKEAQLLAIATRAGGAAVMVRPPSGDSEHLSALLDAGFDGVVAPKVESGEDARRLVEKSSYPPAGTRGFAPRRATGGRATLEAIQTAGSPARMIQIETRSALAEIEAIARTDGVDCLVVGTADLSLELGCPLDMDAPELASAVMKVKEAATRNGKPWGVAIGGVPEWAHDLRAEGASVVVFSSDARIYAEAIERTAQAVTAFETGAHR